MASLGSIKLNHIVWDSDKDPFGFNQWLSEFSDMVRALKDGDVLENFLGSTPTTKRLKIKTVSSSRRRLKI